MIDILNQSNLVSAGASAIFGYFKAAQLNQHELNVLEKIGSYNLDQASLNDIKDARNSQSTSSKIGRLILTTSMVSMLFYIIIVTISKDLPLTLETIQSTGWLSRIWYGPTRHIFITLKSAIIPSWMPELLFMYSGFYFGASRRL